MNCSTMFLVSFWVPSMVATPTLMVMGMTSSSNTMGSRSTSSRICSANSKAPCWSVSGNTTTNSSPP